MKVYVLDPDVNFSPAIVEDRTRIVSVFLSKGEGLHNFRCIECGRIVFQYTGNVELIFDGAVIPKEKASIDVLCHRCHIRYRVL